MPPWSSSASSSHACLFPNLDNSALVLLHLLLPRSPLRLQNKPIHAHFRKRPTSDYPLSAAFIGASFTSQIWHLILSQGVAFGAGMGFLFTGSVGLVPQWFTRRRSLANSIGSAGSGFGGLTYSLAANAMIHHLGLAWAFRILAILAFAVNGVCSFLARDRNREVGAVHQAFHGALLRNGGFYLFLGWGFFSILGYIIVVFSLASYASAVGFTSTQGSTLAAVLNCERSVLPFFFLSPLFFVANTRRDKN